MKGLSRTIAAVAVLGLVAAACGGNDTATPGTGDQIPVVEIAACQTAQGPQEPAETKGVDFTEQLREPGVLNVGSDNDFPPFEEIKPGADEPTGFDVDLYQEIADRLGLEAKSTTTDFDALFTQSIPGGRFDIGVSAITIKEDRKQSVDFTIPYFQADLSVAVNVERTPEISGIEDLAGQTIGAQKGTTGEACAEFLVGEGMAAEVKSFGNTGPAFQDLSAGRVAAVINDRPASEGFIERDDALRVVQIIRTQEQYGIAISKDKPDLRVAINDALREIMEDGTYAEIYEEWFGTPPPYDVPLE